LDHPCWSTSPQKRAFDVIVSVAVLFATLVVGLIVWVLVKFSSSGPAFFTQQRVGRGGELFTVYKFRTMVSDEQDKGPSLTRCGDHRLTPAGKILRKLKVDEIPQFYNVLRGDMSIVGPRPKLPQYSVQSDWKYRPGITGLATLAFRMEEDMLQSVEPGELDAYYDRKIKPLKARLDRRYMHRASFLSDLLIIWATAACIAQPLRAGGKRVRRILVHSPAWAKEADSARISFEAESID
jgi:lipopolysaccharide/colanic/teichoic acid biosynthesis glycosyltransferase